MQMAFNEYTKKHLDFLLNSRIIVAVSGGLDSVVLAYLCHQLGLNIALAHCNFNLREKESDADEEFVLELADQLNVEVFVQNFDTNAYAEDNKTSIQMAARELRYDWFYELADQLNFDYILTAHHADDNLETFLINFTRGTGLKGLKGIPVVNDKVVRPFLSFSREDIETYARENHLTWREDSSNSSRKYLRNKLRHEIVPILKEINPQLLESFQVTLENLNDTADIVAESLNAVAKRAIVEINEEGITYKVSEFKKVNNSRAYLFEMFKDYGFTEWNDVEGLLDAETGKYVSSHSHRLTKHREFLILTEVNPSKDCKSSIPITKNDKQIDTSIGQLNFEEVVSGEENTKSKIYIDKSRLHFPLLLRPWQKGDIFYPLGMKGKKKVSKYLKDEKLTPAQKEKTWILESDGKIVWVIGMRADDRFKISESSSEFFKIELL